MCKVRKAQTLLESAYIEACEKEIPFPESRYICLHSQTISLCASYTPSDFSKYCYSRTNNSFCDELNYVYRKMFSCLKKKISEIQDENSKQIWEWLINEKKCIDDNYYKRTNVFNGDFSQLEAKNYEVENPAQNDWTKSCWKLELERILEEEPELLTDKEKDTILSWKNSPKETLFKTYDSNNFRVSKNSIKTMDYYRSKNEGL